MNDAYFTLPATFQPADYLPFRMRGHHDTARWFVSTILTKLARQHGREVVRLHAQHLKRMMGDNYARIVGALLDGRAVYRRPYSIGESFGYGLSERFASDKHVVVAVSDDVMRERIKRQRERVIDRNNRLFLPVHHQLFNHQTRLVIDGEEARRCLATLPEKCNRFDAQGIQIREIESKQWRMTISRWGRVQNNITSLKRELRTHLRLGNDRLWELDLVAAQPSLLALLIQNQTTHFNKVPNHRGVGIGYWPASPVAPSLCPADAAGFRAVVLDGDLYGCLADAASVLRNEAKRRVLVDVLAKRGSYPSVIEDAFKREFPSVHGYIRAVNRDDHATLIRTLQRLESWLVIEQVCGRIDAPVLTLHDAIFAAEENMPTVERAFQSVTDSLDFPMRWRVSRDKLSSCD